MLDTLTTAETGDGEGDARDDQGPHDTCGDGRQRLIGDARQYIIRDDFVRRGLCRLDEALILGHPLQPIGVRRGQRRKQRHHQSQYQPNRSPAQPTGRRASRFQQIAPHRHDEGQRPHCDQPLANTDKHVHTRHRRQGHAERRCAGEGQLDGACDSRDHDRRPRCSEPADEEPPTAPTRQKLHPPIDPISNQSGDDRHIGDVGPHDQQPTVLKQQRLDRNDGGHRQDAGPRPQQNRSQRPTDEMAGGAPSDGEIEHLRGEDKSGQDPHQWDLSLSQRLATAPQSQPHPHNGQPPTDQRHRQTEEPIGDVHGRGGRKSCFPCETM